MQDYDKLITYTLPCSKILLILLLRQGIIMIVRHNYQYQVLKLQLPKCALLASGKLSHLSYQIERYDRNKVIYICDGRLEVLDWVCKQITVVSQFTFSAIYSNFCAYYLDNDYIAFWKQSSLKHQENYTYEIQILAKSTHKLIKKQRMDLKTLHSLSLVCVNQAPHLVLYQTQGYNLIVQYPDLNIFHEIKSIYKLLLVNSTVKNNKLYLYFTHNELLEQIVLVYEIEPYSVRKDYETKPENNCVKLNHYYQLVLPNLIQNYSKTCYEVTARIKFTKQHKMLLLLHEVLGKDEQMPGDLLKQFMTLIQQC